MSPPDTDVVAEARELLASTDKSVRVGYALQLVAALADEVEQLRKIQENRNDAVKAGLIIKD